MRIGIKFVDNDFYNTLKPFMEFLMKSIRENPGITLRLTKERIVEIFNSMAKPIYILCQQRTWSPVRDDYITIDTDCVYLEKEIDKKLKTYDNWVNNDFFYIDTDNNQFNCW